jgi:hypothetical protein
MSPINGDIILNIEPFNFPSKKTVVESFGTISKIKQFHIIKEEDENENNNDGKYGELVSYNNDKTKSKTNNKEDDDDNENDLFELNYIEEKFNMNDSPVIKRKTVYYSANTSEKNLHLHKKKKKK